MQTKPRCQHCCPTSFHGATVNWCEVKRLDPEKIREIYVRTCTRNVRVQVSPTEPTCDFVGSRYWKECPYFTPI
jgi:hypothetical protein